MNTKDFVVGGVAALALVIGVMGLGRAEPVNTVVEKVIERVGAASPDFYTPVYLADTATIGGRVFATSSVGAGTYTAANIQSASLIQHTAASALTVTFPASSTLTAMVPKAGDFRTMYFAPITSNIVLVGGTGTDINVASSSTSCIAGRICRLDFVRKSNSDIEVHVTN